MRAGSWDLPPHPLPLAALLSVQFSLKSGWRESLADRFWPDFALHSFVISEPMRDKSFRVPGPWLEYGVDWAGADVLGITGGRDRTRRGTKKEGQCRGRNFWGPWSPVSKCEAPGTAISVEEHTSMAPRPRRQDQNPPLHKSSVISAIPWS
jgi:hypothetical protein